MVFCNSCKKIKEQKSLKRFICNNIESTKYGRVIFPDQKRCIKFIKGDLSKKKQNFENKIGTTKDDCEE